MKILNTRESHAKHVQKRQENFCRRATEAMRLIWSNSFARTLKTKNFPSLPEDPKIPWIIETDFSKDVLNISISCQCQDIVIPVKKE